MPNSDRPSSGAHDLFNLFAACMRATRDCVGRACPAHHLARAGRRRRARGPSGLDLHIAADGPARLLQTLQKYSIARLSERIVGSKVMEDADVPLTLALLRPRRERPRCRCAKQREEFAALHSITLSARASSVGGIVRPSAVAVIKFMTRSNLVGCSTGKPAGFAPRRILSTKSPARRNRSETFAP